MNLEQALKPTGKATQQGEIFYVTKWCGNPHWRNVCGELLRQVSEDDRDKNDWIVYHPTGKEEVCCTADSKEMPADYHQTGNTPDYFFCSDCAEHLRGLWTVYINQENRRRE